MPILIDRNKRVLVQGITGREGITRTQLMLDYGTQIVGGVTPGKGGQTVLDVPVFDTVQEAYNKTGGIDTSVIFVPAPLVKDAALEALDAGIKMLVIVPDRVPLYDVLEIAAEAQAQKARFIGPNTLGLLSPGEGVLGMMGGRAENIRKWFAPGPVGMTSRSGGMTTSTAYYIAQAGMGISTMVHVGGDAVVGTTHADVLHLFQQDEQTQLVVLFGEIGTSQEEDAASLIENGGFTKPLIAYIGGKAAQKGTRFSHAGAIIEGNRGTHEGKVKRLRQVGAVIVDTFSDIPRIVAQTLEKIPTTFISIPPVTDKTWYTAITEVKPNAIRLRGQRIDQLMGNITFGQAIYLALTGKLPDDSAGRLIDAILVSSIDHGATPPSTLAARTAASTGAPMNGALAVGLLSINQHHGGAVEDCMRLIADVLALHTQNHQTVEEAASSLVQEYQSKKQRLPGFGHRVHTLDPRATRLFELAASEGITRDHVKMVLALRDALHHQSGRRLPVNIDGAMAAVLLDLGIPPELGNTFFMMARLPGLVAHIYEEKTRERPMRHIDPTDHRYNGQ